MWESPVPEFEGLDMSQLGTDEAFLRVQQSGEHCTVLYCTVLYCTVLYCTVLAAQNRRHRHLILLAA